MTLTKQFNRKEIFISTLYIVPTPIGNLGDITQRAISVLSSVDIVAAEDTRRTKLLLQHFSIHTRLVTLHNYNEHQKSEILLGKLKEGKKIALVSNAGTPLINDPGYRLVRLCQDEGIHVVPLPGACAAITALSASGLPTNRFCYEGFLPTKSKARRDTLYSLNNETRTLIFYESTHRLINSLQDMVSVWGPKRYVVLARELTKIWESLYGAPVGALLTWVLEDCNRCKGEIVLIIEGYKPNDKIMLPVEVLHTLTLLQQELSLKTAIALTAKIHSVNRKILYKYTINEQST